MQFKMVRIFHPGRFSLTILFCSFIVLFGLRCCTSSDISESLSDEGTKISSSCQVTINKCSDHVLQTSFSPPNERKQNISKVNATDNTETEVDSLKIVEGNDAVCGQEFLAESFKFRLQPPTLLKPELDHNCSVKEFRIQFGNNKSIDSEKEVNNESEGIQTELDSPYLFSHEGFIHQKNLTLTPSNYCISQLDDFGLTVKACVSNEKKKREINTIRKCCPRDEVLSLDVQIPNLTNWTCVKIKSVPWTPILYANVSQRNLETIINEDGVALEYNTMVGTACNRSKIMKTPHGKATGRQREQIRVTDSGTIFTRASGNHKWVDRSDRIDDAENPRFGYHCIDGLLESHSTEEFIRNEENQVIIYCVDPKVHQSNYEYVHTSIMVVSSFFLTLVVITYLLVWNEQNIHGWTVASYSFFMLGYLISLIIENVGRIRSRNESDFTFSIGTISCTTLGIFIHFFFLSIFSWMAVINLDLFLTIGSISPIKGREPEKKRFAFYTLFAIGVPLAIVSISVFIEFYFGRFDDSVLRPLYGNSRCSLDQTAVLYYANVINMFLFASSILLSCFTLKCLIFYLNEGTIRRRAMRKRCGHTKALLLGKVFVLLAFSWVFEVAGIIWSFFATSSRWFVVLFDIHNFIQSVGFFGIFVCKKEIQELLAKKYRFFAVVFSWLEQTFQSNRENSDTVEVT